MKEILQHPIEGKTQRKLHTSQIPEKMVLEEMRERKITGRATQGANIIGIQREH